MLPCADDGTRDGAAGDRGARALGEGTARAQHAEAGGAQHQTTHRATEAEALFPSPPCAPEATAAGQRASPGSRTSRDVECAPRRAF